MNQKEPRITLCWVDPSNHLYLGVHICNDLLRFGPRLRHDLSGFARPVEAAT